MTSAPRSARICPAQGPARMRASSRTRNPVNGPGMINPLWVGGGRASRLAFWRVGSNLSIGPYQRAFFEAGGGGGGRQRDEFRLDLSHQQYSIRRYFANHTDL